MKADLTEAQLEWLRKNVPHFRACEMYAKRALEEAEATRQGVAIATATMR